ncbi:B-cell receptor CD22-like [Xenopus laevis]|uniref:B-cell receptor CD22-like n=1 Tax=Xenopus laevis TaxID=8355 RepID=A0A8J1L7Z5_XENLA|nr:B-cell receptor CD22-like [Xenopus laevis]
MQLKANLYESLRIKLQMMEVNISLNGIFLLAALQGWFPGSECQDYYAYLPQYMKALKGSCVEIPCKFNMETTDFQLVWYMDEYGSDPQIFNNKNPSNIIESFRDRTFQVENKSNSCSLRIDDVRHSETYYPCINGNINCNLVKGYNKVQVQVSDTQDKPVLKLPTNLTEDKPARITCSVQHTCTHNPPVLEWNKVGFNKREWREELEEGVWRFVHEMDYIPTYQDHGSPIICKSKYRSGQVSQETVTLDITYPPKDVVITKLDDMKKIKEGEQVTLQCNSNANPPAQYYTWYCIKREGKEELKEHGEKITVTINWENAKYSCSARNKLGKDESTIKDLRLFLYAKVVQMGGKQTFIGDVLKLECLFLMGSPSSTQYSWYRNGISFNNETQRTLTIFNVKEFHSGNYSCNVHFQDGNFSSLILTVTVTQAVSGNIFIPLIALLIFPIFCCIFRTKRHHRSKNMESEVREATYTDLIQRDASAEYSEFEVAETTDNPYAALQKPNTDTYEEIKPPRGQHHK